MRVFNVMKSLQAGIQGLRPCLSPRFQRYLSSAQSMESDQPRTMKIRNGEKVSSYALRKILVLVTSLLS